MRGQVERKSNDKEAPSKAGETKSVTNIEKHLEGRIHRAGGNCNSKRD